MFLEFDDGWTPEVAGSGFAHGGIAWSSDGRILTSDPDGGRLLVLDPKGRLLRTIRTTAAEAHGLTLTTLNGRPSVWIADPGFRVVVDGAEAKADRHEWGRVFAIDLETGSTVVELDPPHHPLYTDLLYRPTFVVVGEAEQASSDIWVADGYGASLVHRYSADGRYRESLDGETGAGRFDCPHGLHVDRRRSEPYLYVSDRGNRRIQVFDLDGRFCRAFGQGELTSPSGFAALGDRLVVAELEARLVVLDEDDRVEAVIGENEAAVRRPGWPNRIGRDGVLERPDPFIPARLNSPHAVVADTSGSVYVTEYVLGGRLSRFRPVDPQATRAE